MRHDDPSRHQGARFLQFFGFIDDELNLSFIDTTSAEVPARVRQLGETQGFVYRLDADLHHLERIAVEMLI